MSGKFSSSFLSTFIFIVIIGGIAFVFYIYATPPRISDDTVRTFLDTYSESRAKISFNPNFENIKRVFNEVLDKNESPASFMRVSNYRFEGRVKRLSINYTSKTTFRGGIMEEASYILGVFTAAVSKNWDIDDMSIIAKDPLFDIATESWTIDTDSVFDFLDEKISAKELLSKIANQL